MKRKIYQKMLEWKTMDKGTSALLIDGARRVGKSYIAEEFAKNEYKSYLIINFSNLQKDVEGFFENDFTDLDLFFNKLSAFYRTQLFERDSLIIFDEVQRYPKARELIKYFVADGRYDYLETGSLVSLKVNVENIVIPSEEEHIEMYPMDFEEFLWAMGDEVTIPLIKKCFEKLEPVGQALHKRIMNDYRQYLLVGGMPQAVEEYVKSKDFEKVDRIKKRIIWLYRSDVTKFAGRNKAKVLSIFDELPSQLSKKEKVFKLTSIKKEARSRGYDDAFLWLSEAMISNNCFNATDPSFGLSLSEDNNTRKCYMADTGLLVTFTFMDDNFMNNELYRAILLDKLEINEGMLMENIVAQELRATGRDLFFYSRSDTDNRENDMKIDFLIKREKKICPVEVKSGKNLKHVSLDKFRERFKKNLGQSYIIYSKDLKQKDEIIYLPIYMTMFL